MMDNHLTLAKRFLLVFSLLGIVTFAQGQDARNYGLSGYDGTFSTGTNASLEDMSSGTTTLIGSGENNNNGSLTSIGFDVWFMGTRYTQFSVNTGGVLQLGSNQVHEQGNTPSIDSGHPRLAVFTSGSQEYDGEPAPRLGSWETASSTGKVHYKVTGSEPNRVLVVEWKDIMINHNSGLSDYATFQAHVYETAPAPTTTDGGEIIFIYGDMPMNPVNSSSDTTSISGRLGIGAGGNTGDYLHVNIASTPAATTSNNFGGVGGTAYENTLYSTPGVVPNLNSPTANNRRYIRFETDDVTGVPSNFTASCITTSTIDLSWSDPATTNGVGIVIYRSTNGTDYSFLTQEAIGAETYSDTGLSAGQTYYYRLYVVNEGKMSDLGAEASLTVATVGGGTVAYAISSGNWNAASTWSTGSAPDASTSVVVSCNYTVTVTSSGANCAGLTIASGSTVDFNTNGGINIDGDISNAGTFNMEGTGVTVNLAGDLTNTGTWMPGESTFTFDGSSAQSVSNTGTSQFTVSGGSTTTSFTYNTSGTITDGGYTNFDLSNVNVSGTITNVTVDLDIEHTNVSDLVVRLANNTSGSTIRLLRYPWTGSAYCSGDDIDATFDDDSGTDGNSMCLGSAPTITGTVSPYDNLSNFDGDASTGTWRLRIYDWPNYGSGQLNSYTLNITSGGGSSTETTNDIAFYDYIMNNANGVTFTNDDARITNNLTLTSGVVAMGSNEMIFNDDATSAVGSNASHVTGTIRKIGDDAFDYPIGNGTYLACIGMSAPSATTDEFTATYTRSDPHSLYDTDTKVAALNNISRVEYWNFSRAVGSSSVYVALSYDNARSGGVGDVNNLRVAHWYGGQWINEETGGSYTPGFTGIVSSMAVDNFSPFTLASTDAINPLPVSLIDFTAKRQEEAVLLEWNTASEENSDYFGVERSLDGESFEEIGTVDAAGETNKVMEYNFLDDDDQLRGAVYYRLRMVDQDGSFEYSSVRQVMFEVAELELLVFPNPFSEQLNLQYSLPTAGEVSVTMTDMLGRQISSEFVKGQNGLNSYQMTDLSSLPKGAYVLQLRYGQQVISRKVIK